MLQADDLELPAAFRERAVLNAALAAGSGVLALAALWLVLEDGDPWAWVGVGFFGLCALAIGWMVLHPPELVIDEDGMTFTVIAQRTSHIPWDLVEAFEMVEIRTFEGARAARMIGFHFVDDIVEQRPDLVGSHLARSVANSLTRVDGALPSTSAYGQDHEELLALLEQLRVRHGGSR